MQKLQKKHEIVYFYQFKLTKTLRQLQKVRIKNFVEPAMFCHLASCTHLALWIGRQVKRPEVHAKQKGFKNFFRCTGSEPT